MTRYDNSNLNHGAACDVMIELTFARLVGSVTQKTRHHITGRGKHF